ncbi:MAG: DUF4214 domain-containing protein [Pseudomonadota bacterium]
MQADRPELGAPGAAPGSQNASGVERAEAVIHVVTGTAGDDSWTLIQPGYYSIDGLGGKDTIDFGTVLRTDFSLSHQADGSVRMDSLSGASGAFHATLSNIESLLFNSGRDIINLATFFGDVTPPLIEVASPANASHGVGAAANIAITFSEAIKFGSGAITLQSGLGEAIETFSLGHGASIAGNVLTLDPSHDFSPNTSYTVQFDTDAIEDMAGNRLSAATTYGFSTALSPNHAPTGSISISGTLQQGQDLSITNTLADADGIGTLHYQWFANGRMLGGEHNATIALTPLMVDSPLSVEVSYVDAMGNVERISSASTRPIGGSFASFDEADYIVGSRGDDIITSGAGNDIVHGGGGSDRIDGGPGRDTVMFDQARANFTLTPNANGFTLADNSSGDIDTFAHVERLYFTDMALALDADGVGGKAYRIYQAAFNRTPDPGGLGFWIHAMDNGVPLDDVAGGFVNSSEWTAMYGSSPSNASLVDKLYLNILHRTPDPGGDAFWLGVLNEHKASVAQVLAAISESDENVAALAGVISHGMPFIVYG